VSKALITGGAGFIGFHLARGLRARGYQVDLLDSFARAVRDPDLNELLHMPEVRLIEGDVMDPRTLRDLQDDYTHVFHLAAVVGVRHVLERPFAVLDKNTAMLSAVINASRRQQMLRRLLFASTSEVYSGTLQRYGLAFPTPETTPLTLPDLNEPRTSYLLSKIYGESMCLLSGLPVTVLRPHNFYGPRMGMSHVIPELLSRAFHAVDGEDLDIYSASHERTFCYIDDAVEWIIEAAESDACVGQVLNVGNQAPEVRMDALGRLVASVVGRRLQIQPLPATPGSPVRRCPDTLKLLSLCSHRAKVDLREGIERTFAWYRAHVYAAGGVSAI
jgi:UDP-glucuronate decarboxylase